MVAMSVADECIYAMVEQVTIKSVDETMLTFAARSGSLTGDPDECLLRLFRVPLSETYCKPIAGAPLPVALLAGATGPLYLSRAGWQVGSDDGFPIYGAGQAVFKYPTCAAGSGSPVTTLTIVPSSIVLHGRIEGAPEPIALELLGPDAIEAQDLDWTSAGPVELRLTEDGARRLWVGSTSVRVWPTRLVVQGSPEIDPSVSGEVDVLNGELAATAQRIAYGRLGAPISLVLTQDGITAFHVTPALIAERTRDCGCSKAS